MNYALSFKDLDTYKLAREVAAAIYEISKKFPANERYSLTDQIRRSSVQLEHKLPKAGEKSLSETLYFETY